MSRFGHNLCLLSVFSCWSEAVGDSLEHDIAGAQAAGWDSLLVQGGLYASDFAQADHDAVLASLVTAKACRPPTYSIEVLT